ncbi:MAG: hypothetical protein J3Q66DRAFT_351075 [Benniella sp.]|nr:MAG: hypothetical protein J3Q66DRAFT_351075 [Benniella sp.]
MTTYPSQGWRRTVGPQWSSVKHRSAAGAPPGMQQGFHSSYLNALSRPDLNMDFHQDHNQDQNQVQQRHTPPEPLNSASSGMHHLPGHHNSHASLAIETPSSHHTDTLSEHQKALAQHQENQRQQELYLQQLQLMQRLQTMPGSTSRPWYPTFGPAITTTCSDSTIQLDNPNQFTLINNAKLNRHAVGPHWRSIQTSATYSPTSSPPPSSPQMHVHAMAPSLSASVASITAASTTNALHAYLSATYSSAASIDHVRAASFHQHEQEMETASESSPSHLHLVHRQYYQTHSYPHDPRHHLMQNKPGNSQEARESHSPANRTPVPPVSVKTTPITSNAKRKASWEDDDEDDDDEDKNEGVRSSQDESVQPYHSVPYPTPTSSTSQHTQFSLSIQSSVQQFVPVAGAAVPHTPVEQDQDQDMNNAAEAYSNLSAVPPTSGGRDAERLDADQDGMDIVESTANGMRSSIKLSKRTRPRLEHSAFGISMAEARRLQSGEQVQDILQECFYNAAASSTR